MHTASKCGLSTALSVSIIFNKYLPFQPSLHMMLAKTRFREALNRQHEVYCQSFTNIKCDVQWTTVACAWVKVQVDR